ncbi:hypothetical protein NE237_013295 [Protea cynaroides]|uniref:Uncharacterized protein n=1 Tax=Protea cynaroides TaxID=273540 RepID=A0A9Q0GYC9_9MAGN|nr:hypothetical protein NE237_013295 [Protea cynaroides]
MLTKPPVEAAEDCVQGAPPIVVAQRLKGLGLRINGSILRRSQGLILWIPVDHPEEVASGSLLPLDHNRVLKFTRKIIRRKYIRTTSASVQLRTLRHFYGFPCRISPPRTIVLVFTMGGYNLGSFYGLRDQLVMGFPILMEGKHITLTWLPWFNN